MKFLVKGRKKLKKIKIKNMEYAFELHLKELPQTLLEKKFREWLKWLEENQPKRLVKEEAELKEEFLAELETYFPIQIEKI